MLFGGNAIMNSLFLQLNTQNDNKLLGLDGAIQLFVVGEAEGVLQSPDN